jgi:hypothetical protein
VDKENVRYTHNGVLFSHNEEQNHVICRKIDETKGNNVHMKQTILRYVSCFLTYVESKKDMKVEWRLLEKKKGNKGKDEGRASKGNGEIGLKYIYVHV